MCDNCAVKLTLMSESFTFYFSSKLQRTDDYQIKKLFLLRAVVKRSAFCSIGITHFSSLATNQKQTNMLLPIKYSSAVMLAGLVAIFFLRSNARVKVVDRLEFDFMLRTLTSFWNDLLKFNMKSLKK